MVPPVESDARLMTRVRSGDRDAFDILYSRHRAAASYVAAAQTDNASDSDDVVAEAFASVFQSLTKGKGPETLFRAYLLTAVRRISYARNRSASRNQPTDDGVVLDSAAFDDDPVLKEFESTAVAKAFRTLPERWQAVLWYVDIEGMKPAAASTLIGLSPNGVSSLVLRAREGLRRAYLQNHVNITRDDPCAEFSSQLGAFARKGLKRSSQEKVQAHLEECSKCTGVVADLNDVKSAMRAVVFPLMTGITFTPAMPAVVASGSGSGPLADLGSRSSNLLWKIGAGALILVGLTVGIVLAGVIAQKSPEMPSASGRATQESPPPVATVEPGPNAAPSQTPAPEPRDDAPTVPRQEASPQRRDPSAIDPGTLTSEPRTQAPATAPTAATAPTPMAVPGRVIAPTPVSAPAPVTSTPPMQTVSASFKAESGTTASDVNVSIVFTLNGDGTPTTGAVLFVLSAGADIIPGKVIEPSGWNCMSQDADNHQIRCTTVAMDPGSIEFTLGISVKDPSVRSTLNYQLGGQGIETTTFSNSF